MKRLGYLLTLFTLCLSTAWAAPVSKKQNDTAPLPAEIEAGIDIGNSIISVSTTGKIKIQTPTENVILKADSTSILENGPTDIQIAPHLLNGPGDPVFGQNRPLSPFDPNYGVAHSELLNRLSAYFSTASGGFGFRMIFDRQISPNLRTLIAPEFLTYSFVRSSQILGDQMPTNTTRITLFQLPLGLQHQISPKSRVVPHIGFGVGPILRFDHRSPRPGYYPNNGSFRAGFQNGQDALGFTFPILTEDYPDLSLTLGGHAAAGVSFKLGSKKDLGLSVEGRYTLAKFTDAFGSPGDFSGFSLGIGFGKHF